ncbi:hypothetical protein L3X38_027087 [Prunus dulcis]|uniref:Uncharacterized protein n=1 Tax=Prunus dulcis TaxID=3755 RepID=A0AAD4VPK2_PRUDU|nr:hypothetical protein L3X38_027087 [Prunus dulcis]
MWMESGENTMFPFASARNSSGHGRTRDRSRSTRLAVPNKLCPFSPSETKNSGRRSTGSNRNCSAVAPPPPPPKLGD